MSQSCILQLLGIWIESCKASNPGSPGNRRFVWVPVLVGGWWEWDHYSACRLPSFVILWRKGLGWIRKHMLYDGHNNSKCLFSFMSSDVLVYTLLATSRVRSVCIGGTVSGQKSEIWATQGSKGESGKSLLKPLALHGRYRKQQGPLARWNSWAAPFISSQVVEGLELSFWGQAEWGSVSVLWFGSS